MPPDTTERRPTGEKGGTQRDAHGDGTRAMLSVPDVTDMDAPAAALAYAKAGWYVGPVRRGTKDPGSVLGGAQGAPGYQGEAQ